MRLSPSYAWLVGLVLGSAGAALAAEPFIYPKGGQSQEQLGKDKYECYEWAKQQSSFDPMNAQASVPAVSAPPAPAPQGGAVRGAARGAAVGAAVGAIAGDAGKGAGIGAAAGGMGGAMRKRDQQREQASVQQQSQQQQQAAVQQGRDAYDRAYKACLEGRNYTVN